MWRLALLILLSPATASQQDRCDQYAIDHGWHRGILEDKTCWVADAIPMSRVLEKKLVLPRKFVRTQPWDVYEQ